MLRCRVLLRSHRTRCFASRRIESLKVGQSEETGMSWKIQHAVDGDVLVVTVTGELSDANVRQFTERLRKVIPEIRADKLLVDMRQVVGRPSQAETFFLYHRHLAWRWPAYAKVALLDLEERRDYASFHQTTAENAGCRFTYFFDYDKAMAWLTAIEPHKRKERGTSRDAGAAPPPT